MSDCDPETTRGLTDTFRDEMGPLSEGDHKIVMAAQELLHKRFAPGRHHFAAAGRGKSGSLYFGLHLYMDMPRAAAMCAEAFLLSNAVSSADELETVVVLHINPAIRPDSFVVPICPACVERFNTYAPQAQVIVDFEGQLGKIPQSHLPFLRYPLDQISGI